MLELSVETSPDKIPAITHKLIGVVDGLMTIESTITHYSGEKDSFFTNVAIKDSQAVEATGSEFKDLYRDYQICIINFAENLYHEINSRNQSKL